MAQPKETPINPTSPDSSTGGADSYNHDGTPDTKLTAFSPDDANSSRSAKLLKDLGLGASNAPDPIHFPAKQTDTHQAAASGPRKDPFTSVVTPTRAEQKLSPTASSFRPITATPIIAHGSLDRQTAHGTNSSPPNYLPGFYQTATPFSRELGVFRYLLVSSSGRSITTGDVESYFVGLEQQIGVTCMGKCSLFPHEGKIYVRLTNIRYASVVHDFIKFYTLDWHADYIPASDFYKVVSPGAQVEAVPDGQVQIVVRPAESAATNATSPQIEKSQLIEKILSILQREGEIFAFRLLDDDDRNKASKEPSMAAYRAVVEFADLDVAVAAMSKYNGTTWPGFQLWLTLPEHDSPVVTRSAQEIGQSPSKTHVNEIANQLHGMSVSKTPQATTVSRPMLSPMGPQMSHQQVMYPVVYHNPYPLEQTPSRHQSMTPVSPMTPMPGGMPMMGPIYTPPSTPMTMHSGYTSPRALTGYVRPDGRRQNAMRVNRSPYHVTGGHHNQVDVNRIREGIDVRTTIMLRNIPNKVNQAMLKEIIDQSSWGKYDFMYLRIDFANDCNVGYAFINFVDPLHIIDFVNARANQRWNCFKSDKVAEVSYATIQGKDCLVQKFRNSSVMLEAPHYRPKLYYTLNGPMPELAGREEPFPEPDNQSKMKRSCENAEHVGLFTPNAGQHFRDEQRRRRSQYDRGTRLAALEEYDYNTQVQQQQVFMPMGN